MIKISYSSYINQEDKKEEIYALWIGETSDADNTIEISDKDFDSLFNKKEKVIINSIEFNASFLNINNLVEQIEKLKKVNEQLNEILLTYIVKLVQNSSIFSNAEKESLWLIIDNFDEATLKEIELNNILYPDELNLDNWKTDTDYNVGDKFVFETKIYKVIQNHKSQLNWSPSQIPALYQLIGQKKEINQIKDWIQPTGGHDAYNIGDLVKFNNKIYKSLINGNVWSPDVYPQGWEEQNP